MRTALIDCDVVAYMASASVQSKFYVAVEEDGEVKSYSPSKKDFIETLSEAGSSRLYTVYKSGTVPELHRCVDSIMQIMIENVTAEKIVCVLTGTGNFRESITDEVVYKGNRLNTEKPIMLDDARDYLITGWGAKVINGKEADDELGILQTSMDNTIICTVDKDLSMIPGEHYNIKSGETFEVSELEGLKFFYKQILTGDPVDNIPGIFKWTCGKVKATKAIKDEVDACSTEDEMLNVVFRYYIDSLQDLSRGHFCFSVSATMLWIQRAERENYFSPDVLSTIKSIIKEYEEEKNKV